MSDLFSLEDEVTGAPGGEPLEGALMPPSALDGLPAGTGMLQVRGAYSTAVRVEKKRDIYDVNRRLLEEASLMGEAAYYGWGAGKDRIEGPSQELALAAARLWGNCALEVAPIQETAESWIITTYFIDLETGFTMARPFRMSKRWTVHGKLDAERKNDVRFQIGATKSARNVVLKAIPGWMIDKALEQAKSGVRKKLEKYIETKGMPAAQDLALSVLLKAGVKEDSVLRKFGVASRSALDVEKLVIIQGDIRAIQGGEARPDEIYPSEEAEAGNGSKTQSLADRLAKKKPEEEPATSTTPSLARPGERLSAAQVKEVRGLVERSKVSLERLEEAYGGPLEEIVLPGLSAKELEAELVREVKAMVAAREAEGQLPLGGKT